MGLLRALFMLPAAPVKAPVKGPIKGTIWLGELIQNRVEQEVHDPANVRRELEQIDEAASTGELSEDAKQEAQQEVLNRMIQPNAPQAAEEPKD